MFETKETSRINIPTGTENGTVLLSFTPKELAKKYIYIVLGLTIAFVISGTLLKVLAVNSKVTDALYRIFNMDAEANLPAAFSFLNLITASLILLYLASTNSKRHRPYWLLLAVIFVFLAFDELFQIHEYIGRSVGPSEGSRDGWKIPYAIAATVIGGLMLRFVFELPKKTRIMFFVAGATFVLCAIFIDYLQSVLLQDYHTKRYHQLLTTIEEPGEMLAIILFIYAMLDYISPGNRRIQITSVL